jgi:branched-chain amino acid aminotransferase
MSDRRVLSGATSGYRAGMTSTFTRTPHPSPATPERIAEVLANPGFGLHFTDHMVTVRYDRTQGWHDARVEPYRPITLDPAAMVLHYGQAIFEGLKAYRQPDGTVASFRPEANARRFRDSARRLAMPELPEEMFLDSLRELVAVDGRWVPEQGEESLYLRPLMISTEVGLGVRPAAEYLYLLLGSPAGSYFASGVKPVSVWLSHEYVRAAPGGTGAAKFAGNYAASLVAQAQAAEQGCDQVVWLDAVERRWVEEMGGMNLFFVFGSGADARLVTPELSGALLPGITRNSLLALASSLGYQVEERRISTEEWEKKAESGELTEVFACGTAAVITPVGSVKHADGEFTVNGGGAGEVSMRLREALTAIQRGTAPDPNGWMVPLS